MKSIIVVLTLAFASPLYAQEIPAPAQDLRQTITDLQNQIDVLRAFLFMKTPSPVSHAHAQLDWPTEGANVSGTLALVSGWTLGCTNGPGLGTPAVFLDGLPLQAMGFRQDRGDVQAWATETSFCRLAPMNSGITFLVNLSTFAPGVHALKLRVYDTDGSSADSTEVKITLVR